MKHAMNKLFPSKEFKHPVRVYVPCFQKNPENDSGGSPCFTFSYTDASEDINMVLSMKPDYVLVLKGEFNAKTQPFDLMVVKHNHDQWMNEEF